MIKNQISLSHDLQPYLMKGKWFVEKKKEVLIIQNDDNKAEHDVFKPIWVHWTHQWR